MNNPALTASGQASDPASGADIVAVVGLAGAGKSTVVDMIRLATGAPVVYFGGQVVDEVARRGQEVTEFTEREVREELRRKLGMGAMAILAESDLRDLAARSPLIIVDGLYSYAELEHLQTIFPSRLVALVAVHARRAVREERLARRAVRPLTPDEVASRDLREVRTLDKATPLALADYHLVNDSSVADLEGQLDSVLSDLLQSRTVV